MANTITAHTLGRAFGGTIHAKSFAQSGADYRADQNSRSYLYRFANWIADLLRTNRVENTKTEITQRSEKLNANLFDIASAILKSDWSGPLNISIRDGRLVKDMTLCCNGNGFITISDGTHTVELRHTVKELKSAMLREYLAAKRLEKTGVPISLAGFDLSHMDLSGLDFHDCDFSRAALDHTNFSKCNLHRADFTGAIAPRAKFTGATMTGAIFNDAGLQDADFSHGYLRGSKFLKAHAQGAIFIGADLPFADCSGAKLQRCDFTSALLSEAIFEKANLVAANLTQTTVTRANFTGASLGDVEADAFDARTVTITKEQLRKTLIKDITYNEEQLKGYRTRKAQALIRRYLETGRKESPEADVPALRHGRDIIAYKIPGNPGGYSWVAKPSVEDKSQRKGASKVLTHLSADGRFVRLTLQGQGITRHPGFDTLDADILGFISKSKFKCIIPNYKINRDTYIAQNVGNIDLYHQAQQGQYAPDIRHFAGLARELEVLHAKGIVHRDIKPGNMALLDGQVRLFDWDTAVHLDKIKIPGNVTTEAYLHQELRGMYQRVDMVPPKKGYADGIKVDQYCFFMSICSAVNLAFIGQFNNQQTGKFFSLFQCDIALKHELLNFLNNPIENNLTHPISKYLT